MSKTRIYIGIVFGVALCIGFVVASGVFGFQRWKENNCDLQLEYICMSLDSYCRAHGGLPPQYIEGKDGKPAHSWRALILPHVCYHYVYEKYRFAEPWNSPHNKALSSSVHSYACPTHSTSSEFASYVAVTGKNTLWPLPKAGVITRYRPTGENGTPWPDVESRVKLLSNSGETIVLVELANSDIAWAEPRDISLETLIDLVRADPTGGKLSQYIKRIVTVDASGELHILNPTENPDRTVLLVCPGTHGQP